MSWNRPSGARACVHEVVLYDTAKPLAEMSLFVSAAMQNLPSAAEAALISHDLAARLKSCPFKTVLNPVFLSRLWSRALSRHRVFD